jgi:hypothetical protein
VRDGGAVQGPDVQRARAALLQVVAKTLEAEEAVNVQDDSETRLMGMHEAIFLTDHAIVRIHLGSETLGRQTFPQCLLRIILVLN